MSLLYACDPGTLQSALVVVEATPRGLTVLDSRTLLNGVLLAELSRVTGPETLVIERIQAMGLPIGNETIDTIFWTGRFYEAWPGATTRHLLTRGAIKLHLCGSMRAKDAHIRAVLMDRFGGSNAKGTKRAPGPLYQVRGHEFAALAVAVTWLEQHGYTTICGGSNLLDTPPLAIDRAVTRA